MADPVAFVDGGDDGSIEGPTVALPFYSSH